MKFKVGEWARVVGQKDIEIVNNKNVSIFNNPKKSIFFKHWQPEAGEYVWFWKMHNKELLYMFGRFSHHNEFGYIIDEDENGAIISSKLRYWDNCEPFIGQLPSFIKE